MTTETRINDVDLETVGGLAAAIVDDPTNAHTTWRATVEWNGAFRSVARIRDFDPIASDEPPALGGTDTAPNPVEQVIAALGNCLAVGYAAGASGAGIEINELRIELEGDLDLHAFLGLRAGHAGYEDLRVTVHLDTDAAPEDVAALHDRVVGTSPVGHTLSRAIPLTIKLA